MEMTAGEKVKGDMVTVHDMDYAMQKYLLLHTQHEELRQHLHELCPSLSPLSTTVTSPSVSPTRSFMSGNNSRPTMESRRRTAGQHHTMYSGTSSHLESVLDESIVEEMVAGEQKLSDVNEGIKRALTELLNCEAVRQDKTMRTWVQTRLLETEKELRRGRRRRSSATVD
ncbi:hypothetical protein F5Y16DRAFT_53213 [Xylariaceae sp. FL0255]|nr:hypothetical protein F5Y16DRAFT_53213 [Xylariaceae sp. FL0255]